MKCVVLYGYVSQKLASDGISKKELNSIKHHPMGHRSVESFIETNLKLGNFEWRNGVLINAN